MYPHITLKDYLERLSQEQKEESRQNALSDVGKSLEKVQRRPLTKEDKAFCESLVKKTEGENAGSIRQRFKPAPGKPQWGGLITTERDLSYCKCGRLLADHTPENTSHTCSPYLPKQEVRNGPSKRELFLKRKAR